jgi:predicted MFS family arabinose efflux permease
VTDPVITTAAGSTTVVDRPLSRNREYNVLWTSNVLSQLGAQVTLFAYPLLVLALTGSAIQAALVEFVIAGTRLLVGIPAGALVDRWSRKRVLLGSELARALALGVLATVVALGDASFALIAGVAVVEGVCTALFSSADQALLPLVVPEKQLGDAVARNTARYHVATVVGPGLGGLLFGLQRLLPFLAQSVVSLGAFVALLFLKVPPRPVQEKEQAGGMLAGLKWIMGNSMIRATVILASVFNLVFTAVLFVVIVFGQRSGLNPGMIGLIGVLLGVGGVLGALAAPRLRKIVTPRMALTGLVWIAAVLVPALAIVPVGPASGGVLAAMAFAAPTATTVVMTYQMMTTPDEMRGRLAGVIGVAMSAASALGPLAGGVLVEWMSPVQALLACGAAMLVVAVMVTVSRTVRSFPVTR